MRAYFFGNMYLSSIQQGIQAAHSVADMFVKYSSTQRNQDDVSPHTIQQSILTIWAADHKTMVLLNAGYSDEIRNLINFFEMPQNPFPWAPFYEGKDSLDGALTTVGIVLPEEIYNASKLLREGDGFVNVWGTYTPSPWEKLMAEKLNLYGLAK